jgi:hypothetical protein
VGIGEDELLRDASQFGEAEEGSAENIVLFHEKMVLWVNKKVPTGVQVFGKPKEHPLVHVKQTQWKESPRGRKTVTKTPCAGPANAIVSPRRALRSRAARLNPPEKEETNQENYKY